MIKEALEIVSHALKLKLVLQKTFKHYDIFGDVRGGLLELEFHFDLDVGALLFELLELFRILLLELVNGFFCDGLAISISY